MRAVVSDLALSFNVLRPTSLCQKAASFVFTGHPCGAFVTHGEFFFFVTLKISSWLNAYMACPIMNGSSFFSHVEICHQFIVAVTFGSVLLMT